MVILGVWFWQLVKIYQLVMNGFVNGFATVIFVPGKLCIGKSWELIS
ncbi:MAG: hypothetical protein ACLSCV_11385 [Acutalibacteraceae bacterium]